MHILNWELCINAQWMTLCWSNCWEIAIFIQPFVVVVVVVDVMAYRAGYKRIVNAHRTKALGNNAFSCGERNYHRTPIVAAFMCVNVIAGIYSIWCIENPNASQIQTKFMLRLKWKYRTSALEWTDIYLFMHLIFHHRIFVRWMSSMHGSIWALDYHQFPSIGRLNHNNVSGFDMRIDLIRAFHWSQSPDFLNRYKSSIHINCVNKLLLSETKTKNLATEAQHSFGTEIIIMTISRKWSAHVSQTHLIWI